MYGVVRRYRGASQVFDELERQRPEIERLLQGVPGFVAYYLIRSGDGGASVTICRDQAGTQESTRVAADWLRQNVPAAAGNPPEVIEGEVIIEAGG